MFLLALLVAGLVLLLNQTTWFAGENAVGAVLAGIAGVLLAIQTIISLVVLRKVTSAHDDLRRLRR